MSTDGYIYVTDRQGDEHKLMALNGWRVMEIIRDHGLPLEGTCGGACACATCHVYVDDEWVDILAEQRDEELDMLDEASGEVTDNSRLSCQILFSPELDGLKLTIAPE